MFYKPKFCCNCGTGIERVDWRLWTSRRFCDVCEIEQKGHELLARILIGSAIMFGVFGVGSYFQSSDIRVMNGGADIPGGAGPRTIAVESKRQTARAEPEALGIVIGRPDFDRAASAEAGPQVAAASKEQPAIRKIASDEPIYYCGAMTKKGKPCSRRVRSDHRCWQHAGQPSAATVRKAADMF